MGELEEIARVFGGEVDAAVASAVAEVVVPEGRVEAVGTFEELDPGDVLNRIIFGDVGAFDVVHVGVGELDPDLKDAERGFRLLGVLAG